MFKKLDRRFSDKNYVTASHHSRGQNHNIGYCTGLMDAYSCSISKLNEVFGTDYPLYLEDDYDDSEDD